MLLVCNLSVAIIGLLRYITRDFPSHIATKCSLNNVAMYQSKPAYYTEILTFYITSCTTPFSLVLSGSILPGITPTV